MKKVGFGIISVLCALFMMSCVMNLSEILDSYCDKITLDATNKTTIVGNYGDKSVDVKIEIYKEGESKKTTSTTKPLKTHEVEVDQAGNWKVNIKDFFNESGTYDVKIILSKKDTSTAKFITIEIKK